MPEIRKELSRDSLGKTSYRGFYDPGGIKTQLAAWGNIGVGKTDKKEKKFSRW